MIKPLHDEEPAGKTDTFAVSLERTKKLPPNHYILRF